MHAKLRKSSFALSGMSQCSRPVTECDVKVLWYLQVEAEIPVGVIADSWNADGAGLHLLPTKNHKSVWLRKKKA